MASERNHGDCVRRLLSAPGINANLENGRGETPLNLATEYVVLTLLQKYTNCYKDFPVHTYGKVIMCGDSGAGKTTLTEARHTTCCMDVYIIYVTCLLSVSVNKRVCGATLALCIFLMVRDYSNPITTHIHPSFVISMFLP